MRPFARLTTGARGGGRRGLLSLALLACAAVAVTLLVVVLGASAGRQTSAHAAAGDPVAVVVLGTSLGAQDLGPGRVRVRVRLTHTQLPPGTPSSTPAFWFVRLPGTNTFRLLARTRARELIVGVLGASAVVEPPAASFTYRVCIATRFKVAGPRAVPARARCPQGTYTLPHQLAALEFQGQGSGTTLPAQPSAGAVAAADDFIDARGGHTAFAVMDSHGLISGVRIHEHFESASVVKVMMLTAYLQRLAARHLHLRSSDGRLLYPMIHFSDNNAASAVLRVVGSAALARVAREAGMSDYAPGVGWWAFTQTSAVDQVRLFALLDQLIPARFYGYARSLLASAAPEHSWGIPPVARPRFQVFFKTGSLPSRGLFNEAARLERGTVTMSVAVFTDGDPSPSYGKETVAGVAARLLGAGR